ILLWKRNRDHFGHNFVWALTRLENALLFALPPKAGIRGATQQVRFVPCVDIALRCTMPQNP
ncbi:MAG: hypothetical protein ACKVG0_02365, partial [Alphaproteobacteria bacterium]